MGYMRLLFGTLFFIIGISGNELWGYDMSNIIGDEEAIHITVDTSGNDVSGSDVSGQVYEIDDDFDSLSDNSILRQFKRMWNKIVNGFKRVVMVLRDGTKTTERAHRALERFNDDLDAMISQDKIGKVNFNPFIGMIRWCTGDLIFYEIYIIFSMGISLVWLKVVMVVIEFLRNWTQAVARMIPSFAKSKIFKWIFWRGI